jgi:hypothetical protein
VEKLTTDLLTQGQMLQDSRLVLDNSLSENISLREKLEKLSENEKEEIEKSEEDRSVPPPHIFPSLTVMELFSHLQESHPISRISVGCK